MVYQNQRSKLRQEESFFWSSVVECFPQQSSHILTPAEGGHYNPITALSSSHVILPSWLGSSSITSFVHFVSCSPSNLHLSKNALISFLSMAPLPSASISSKNALTSDSLQDMMNVGFRAA